MIQPYRAIGGSFRPVLEVSTFRSSHLVFLLLDLLPVVTHLSLDFLQEAFTNTPLSSKIGLDVLICSHSIFYLFRLRYVAYCITVDCLRLFWALGQYSGCSVSPVPHTIHGTFIRLFFTHSANICWTHFKAI